MQGFVGLTDFDGKLIHPAVEFRLPELASGQTRDCTAANTDYTLTVEAGGKYWAYNKGSGNMILGVATLATAANILWFISPNSGIGICIPAGYTTLYVQSDNAGDDLLIAQQRK